MGKLTETALDALKDPKAAAGKVVEQARGTAALGRMVAEQVGRTAVSKATGTASTVAERVRTRGAMRTSEPAPTAGAASQRADRADLRAVPNVNEAGHPPAGRTSTQPASMAPAAKAPVKRAGSAKKQGDPVAPAAPKAAKKAPTKRASAKKAPATKSATRKSATKAARKAPTATPADVAEVVEGKADAEARGAANTATTKKAGAKQSGKAGAKKTPAKKASTKKAPAKNSAAEKAGTGPGDKLPPRQEAPTKSTLPQTTTEDAPEGRTAAEVAEGTSDEVTTPVGTTGAGEATNPSTGETDLNQPGTEPIVDPSTTKKVASETEQLRKAAEQES